MELHSFKHQTGDTEGFVNYALSIKGVRMAAFFAERNDMIKISFRSRGNYSVKELAETYFEGGGHLNAAGGRSLLSLEQSIDRLLEVLPAFNLKYEKENA